MSKNKFMVIGIDGVPYELISHYSEMGIMPNMNRLIRNHRFIKTQVPLPEISSVSWTSFMTGMNPGQHGIYGFMELHPKNYSYTFPSFRTLPVKTIWEEIGTGGARSIIVNLPSTYPARPLKGVLVSGFVALDLEKAVYPKKWYNYLEDIEYEVDIDTALARTDKKGFLLQLRHSLDTRYHLYKTLQKKEPWELFFFIITGTDRLHHFFMDAWNCPDSAFYQDFLDYYRYLDQILGEITSDMERQGIPFILLSDHGFVPLKQEVYISQYLKEWGYLFFEDPQPKNLKSITSQSRVFALDPSRLYIHLKDKYLRGCVHQKQYAALREEIKEKFMRLEIDGEKVIRSVYFKEELYNGPYLDQAPDIVLLSHYGYDLKAGVTKKGRYGTTHFTGMHSQDNAMLIDSYGFALDEHPNIVDIGESVKKYFVQ